MKDEDKATGETVTTVSLQANQPDKYALALQTCFMQTAGKEESNPLFITKEDGDGEVSVFLGFLVEGNDDVHFQVGVEFDIHTLLNVCRVIAIQHQTTLQENKPIPDDGPYGRCPFCGAKGISRERRTNGNDRCTAGHVYKSASAVYRHKAPEVKTIVDAPSSISRKPS